MPVLRPNNAACNPWLKKWFHHEDTKKHEVFYWPRIFTDQTRNVFFNKNQIREHPCIPWLKKPHLHLIYTNKTTSVASNRSLKINLIYLIFVLPVIWPNNISWKSLLDDLTFLFPISKLSTKFKRPSCFGQNIEYDNKLLRTVSADDNFLHSDWVTG